MEEIEYEIMYECELCGSIFPAEESMFFSCVDGKITNLIVQRPIWHLCYDNNIGLAKFIGYRKCEPK